MQGLESVDNRRAVSKALEVVAGQGLECQVDFFIGKDW